MRPEENSKQIKEIYVSITLRGTPLSSAFLNVILWESRVLLRSKVNMDKRAFLCLMWKWRIVFVWSYNRNSNRVIVFLSINPKKGHLFCHCHKKIEKYQNSIVMRNVLWSQRSVITASPLCADLAMRRNIITDCRLTSSIPKISRIFYQNKLPTPSNPIRYYRYWHCICAFSCFVRRSYINGKLNRIYLKRKGSVSFL